MNTIKKLIVISPFLALAITNSAHASCYCPQGALSNGQCYIPQGRSQTMRPIGYAICHGSPSQSRYKTPHVSAIDYQKRCQKTQDGGQACSMYVDDWVSFTDFSDKSGKMIFQRFYYQDRRGLVKSESSFNGENNRHGKTVHYHENGQPKYVMNYANGKAQGEERQYDEYGRLIGIIYYDDDGEFHGQFKFFDETGALIRTETFEHGKKTHSQEYLNGQKHGQELFFTTKKGKSKITKKVLWQHGVPTS